MKHENIKNIQEKIKTFSVVVSLGLTIGGVVIGIFNYYTLNQLQPIHASIEQVKADNARQDAVITKLVTKDDLQLVITRIDKISSRLDEVIGILMKR